MNIYRERERESARERERILSLSLSLSLSVSLFEKSPYVQAIYIYGGRGNEGGRERACGEGESDET